MRKLYILVMVAFIMSNTLSSCSYEACPTYSNSSLKKYGPKYSYANSTAKKKQKKNKFW